MILTSAVIGAVVATIPGASFLLIALELFLLYKIADKHGQFDLPSFFVIGGGISTLSAVLKSLASFLHVIPVLGQIANSLVAFAFIAVLGALAESHYGRKARP